MTTNCNLILDRTLYWRGNNAIKDITGSIEEKLEHTVDSRLKPFISVNFTEVGNCTLAIQNTPSPGKYLGIKFHGICILLSNGSEEKKY